LRNTFAASRFLFSPKRRAAHSRRLTVFVAALFSAVVFAADSPPQFKNYTPKYRPFDKGEHAVYQASWLGVPVASATIDMRPVVTDGKKTYHATVKAESWRYLDIIFKMRDVIESTFDAETFHPLRFSFIQRENKKANDTVATVDPATHKWTVQRKENKKRRDFEFESPYAVDTVSAVYLARSLEFKPGDSFQLEVFGGKSRYVVTLDVVGKERVSVKGRQYEAFKIIPKVADLSKSGYAKRVRQATAWITADEQRLPVKMSAQVFVGSVNIELAEESGG
jgi:hypothetical protein